MVSKGTPLTTIKGCEPSLRSEVVPRIRIDIPEPGAPELETMSSPLTLPCRASSTEVTWMPSNSLASTFCMAKEISRVGMLMVPVLVTALPVT